MAVNPNSIVEGVTWAVQTAQRGLEVGSSSNGFEAFSNIFDLFITIAEKTPIGTELNSATAGPTPVDLRNSSPSDDMFSAAVSRSVVAISARSEALITVQHEL